jgi:hypothetical protein
MMSYSEAEGWVKLLLFFLGGIAAIYIKMTAEGKIPFSKQKIDDGRKLIQNQKEIIAAQVEACPPIQETTAITDNIDLSKLAVILPIAIKYGEEGYTQEEGLELLQMFIGATKSK